MKLATLLLIWLAFKVIANLADRKKGRLPPPENSPDLNTPTIANDPNFPGEEVPIFIENPRQAEIRSYTKPAAQIRQKVSNQEVQEETDKLDLNLTPSNVMNAFVLGEILGKPKALRR
jgi:hypothetical protein